MLLNSFHFLFTGWVVAIHLEETGSGTRINRSAVEEEEAEAVVEIGATIPLDLAAVEVQPTSNHKVGALVINNNNRLNHKVKSDLDEEEETGYPPMTHVMSWVRALSEARAIIPLIQRYSHTRKRRLQPRGRDRAVLPDQLRQDLLRRSTRALMGRTRSSRSSRTQDVSRSFENPKSKLSLTSSSTKRTSTSTSPSTSLRLQATV